jgi:hypothetical protein
MDALITPGNSEKEMRCSSPFKAMAAPKKGSGVKNGRCADGVWPMWGELPLGHR